MFYFQIEEAHERVSHARRTTPSRSRVGTRERDQWQQLFAKRSDAIEREWNFQPDHRTLQLVYNYGFSLRFHEQCDCGNRSHRPSIIPSNCTQLGHYFNSDPPLYTLPDQHPLFSSWPNQGVCWEHKPDAGEWNEPRFRPWRCFSSNERRAGFSWKTVEWRKQTEQQRENENPEM